MRNWDATKSNAPAELLQRGFELAYFIIPDRVTSIDILTRALEKIRARSRREMKRLYWRDKHAERPVRRIARSDMDMLQWLIMFEAEQDERAQERAGSISSAGMTIRYIKHLIQITTSMSSFYVNVGVSRLLHNYSTSDTQRVYEMLTSRFLGPDEYRRAKSALMDKLSERFAGFLKVARVDHGELRFETSDNQEQWVIAVSDSLSLFTPWSTQGHCAQFVNVNGRTKLKSAQKPANTDQNDSELRCCHILIEPTCYDQLMKDLAFDAPETRLALPRFVMPDKQEKSDDNNVQPPRPPNLSQEDLDQIQRRLAVTDARRRNANPRIVTIMIDGVEHAQLDLAQKYQLQVGLEAGATLIEIRGRDERGDLLLATHFIPYVNNTFEPSRGTAKLGRGELEFKVIPVATVGQRPPQAILSLNYHARFQWTRPLIAWREFASFRITPRAYLLAGLAMALIGWGVAGAFYSHKVRELEQKLELARWNQQQLSPTAARAIISYALIRDDQRVRGTETIGIPEISLHLHSPAISLELPLTSIAGTPSYSAELKTFTGDQTLMTQNFLQPTRTDNGSVVEMVVPVDLLKADTYYTAHLHSSGRTDRFTFKVVDSR
ncbi:MAG: hypothetical protein LAO78_11135 [Acidobacteriia bacterium]|nr:hypothetical protein [Terriglobia bacterium]